MGEEVVWTRLVFLGIRGSTTAWRALEQEGGSVLFLVPRNQLKEVLLGLRLTGGLVAPDPDRYRQLCGLLASLGLPISLAPYGSVEATDEGES